MIVSVVKYEVPQIIKNVHSAHLLPMRDWIRYVQRQCGSSDYGLHWFSVDCTDYQYCDGCTGITALAVRCDDAGGLYHGVDTVRAGCVPTDEICGSGGAD